MYAEGSAVSKSLLQETNGLLQPDTVASRSSIASEAERPLRSQPAPASFQWLTADLDDVAEPTAQLHGTSADGMRPSSRSHSANVRDSRSHAMATVDHGNLAMTNIQQPDPQGLVSEEDDHAAQSGMDHTDHTTQQEPPLTAREFPACPQKAMHKPMELSSSSGALQTRDQLLAAQMASATRPKLRSTAQARFSDGAPLMPPSDSAAPHTLPSQAMLCPEPNFQQQQLPGPGSNPEQPSVMDIAAIRSERDQHWPAWGSPAGGKAAAGLVRPGKLSGSRIMRFEAVIDSQPQERHDGKSAARPMRPGSAHASKRARRKSLLRSQSRTGSPTKLSPSPVTSIQLHPALEASHTGKKRSGVAQPAMIRL